MTHLASTIYAEGVAEALATMRNNPLRAALAMAAAVATTAIVQTGLDGLARSARDASARAFGSDSFVLANVAAGSLSRRALADRIARNPNITRSDVRFLDAVAGDSVLYAATTQRPADVIAGARKFENATVNGTQATLLEIRDVGVERGRFFTRDEETRGPQVIVAGRAVADELFPGADPLDRSYRRTGPAPVGHPVLRSPSKRSCPWGCKRSRAPAAPRTESGIPAARSSRPREGFRGGEGPR